MEKLGKLIFYCGKMGAGKSTLSTKHAQLENAVLISEDSWLAAHFPEEIQTFEDYLKASSRIKPFIKHHVIQILTTGTNVVMDFPANTQKQRQWFKELTFQLNCPHALYYIERSDEQCLAQLALRREQIPERAHFDNEQVFHQVTAYFEAPESAEGFNIISV